MSLEGGRAVTDAARAVSPAHQAFIAAGMDAMDDTAARWAEQRERYRQDLAGWEADQREAAAWREGDALPGEGVPNPGGDAMPGADPHGRAFLDAIGATEVQVHFDAGPDNCGYRDESRFTASIGGCFDSRFRNRLFLAWEPGAESLVWPVFVHEAMHWYQYDLYYPLFLSARRAGYAQDAYRRDVESDASCRAVALHGIPAADYARSSSPCDVDGWYEGWLPDRLAQLGVRVSEPTAEEYEVLAVVRP